MPSQGQNQGFGSRVCSVIKKHGQDFGVMLDCVLVFVATAKARSTTRNLDDAANTKIENLWYFIEIDNF